MPKNTDKIWNAAIGVWLLLSIIICIMVLFVGCQAPEAEPLIPTTPGQALAEAVAKTNWVIALSIIGIAFSVTAWINGSKTAIGVLVGCAVALWLQITVVRYANVLAWVGLVFAVGVMLWTVFVKNRALKEVVSGVQLFKESRVTIETPSAYTNTRALEKCLKKQNKTTKSIVSQIKGKLPGKKV